MAAAVGEADPGAEHEHPDDAGHEHLIGEGERGDASPNVDRDARDGLTAPLDLSRVQACTNLQTDLAHGIDHCTGALDRARRTIEGREETVTCGIDLDATEAFEKAAHPGVMVVQEVAPSPIPQLLGFLGGADDVG